MATPNYYPSFTIGSWQTAVTDTFGVTWFGYSTDYADGAGVRLNQTPKPFSAGAFRVRSFRDTKKITIQGGIECGNRPTAIAAADRFKALFPDGTQQPLYVDDGVSTRQCLVELADVPKVSFQGPASFDFQLPLSMVDPRFYDTTTQTAVTNLPTPGASGLNWSPTASAGLNWAPSASAGLDWGSSTSTGQITMVNNGSASTFPVFTLVGSLGFPITITDNATSRALTYTQTLNGPSDFLMIDNNPFTRSVLLQGNVDRLPLMSSAQWMEIPAGGSLTVTLSAGFGSGQLQASWRNAYW